MIKCQSCKKLGKELPGRENGKCERLKEELNLECAWEQEVNILECRERKEEREGVAGEMGNVKEFEAYIKRLNFIRVKSYFK